MFLAGHETISDGCRLVFLQLCSPDIGLEAGHFRQDCRSAINYLAAAQLQAPRLDPQSEHAPSALSPRKALQRHYRPAELIECAACQDALVPQANGIGSPSQAGPPHAIQSR